MCSPHIKLKSFLIRGLLEIISFLCLFLDYLFLVIYIDSFPVYTFLNRFFLKLGFNYMQICLFLLLFLFLNWNINFAVYTLIALKLVTHFLVFNHTWRLWLSQLSNSFQSRIYVSCKLVKKLGPDRGLLPQLLLKSFDFMHLLFGFLNDLVIF